RHRPRVGVPLILGGLLTQAQLRLRIGGHRLEVLFGDVATFQRGAKPARRDVLALRGGKPFGPRAGNEIALDVAGCVAEIVRLVRADFERARADWLPDEEGGNFTATERGRQNLRIEVLHGDRLRIDLILGQILRNEPGAGRADTRRNRLAREILRLLDVLAGDNDVALGVALDDRDGAVVAFDTEEILHARQIAGHDDVALAGLECLEGGRSRRE